MQELVDSDIHNQWTTRPPIRRNDGSVAPGMEGLVRWETHSDVLDTFFAVSERIPDFMQGVVGKSATNYFHYIDTDCHNGFKSYYSVVARDHRAMWVGGRFIPMQYGAEEDPSNHFHIALPGPPAQTSDQRRNMGANIYVYPNPATRQALAEFQPRGQSNDDPTGLRVMFNNLPMAHNTIEIFSVAGDLIQTIEHDGFHQGGSKSWNLMTRNGQEIVSGIYLYTVESDNNDFNRFRGKFVVIR